jgi:methylglutamate dehydrogenase subunit C
MCGVMTRCTAVTGAYDGGVYSALERVGLHRAPRADLPRECFWRITAAQDRFWRRARWNARLPLSDNDRPGIMLASPPCKDYLNIYGVAVGQNVVLLANNDDARRCGAADDGKQGLMFEAILDTRPDASSVVEECPVLSERSVITKTKGRHGLRHISRHAFATANFRWTVTCLPVSGGWNPMVHLTCHMNGRPRWEAEFGKLLCRRQGCDSQLWCAVGACNGDFDPPRLPLPKGARCCRLPHWRRWGANLRQFADA